MIAEAISSLFDTLADWRPRNATIENPRMSLQDPRTWDELLQGVETDAGIRITPQTALTLAPVWQAVATISGDIAASTLNIYHQEDEDDRDVDWEHDAQYLVAVQPNAEMSAFEFWRRAMVHALIWGNGYGYIDRQGRSSKGRTLGLLNLLPDRTKPMRTDDGTLYYASEVDGQMEPFRADEILHIKGLSMDISKGCELVSMARNSWGLALAAEGFESKFFKNGTQTGGVLEIPATFTEKAKRVLEEGFDKRTAGKDNWFKTVILRDGAKFHATTIDAQKSQTHELREDQVRDTARFFNLPPFKLGLSDSVSYNSAEQSQIVYLTGCLRHWFSSIEGECDIKLLTDAERRSRSHYFEHNYLKLLEIDSKSMAQVLEIERRNEIINANEWRKKINMNRRKDPGGDTYQNPNTKSAADNTSSGDGGEPAEPQTPPKRTGEKKSGKTAGENKTRNALRDLFRATIDRTARRVCFDARAYAKKPQKFVDWLDGKAAAHREIFSEHVLPVARVIDDDSAQALTVSLDGRFFATLLAALAPLVSPPHSATDLPQNVDSVCAHFEATIAETLTQFIFPSEQPKPQETA